jgi:tetratricopeptide (TPR) repeat protein
VEYLSFSVEEAEAHKDSSELAVSLYYAATAHFLLGNLSKAERLVKQAELSARIAGRPEWALRSLFFLGRCYFESGRYKNAISIFQSLLENTTDTLSPACRETLDAWIFRSKLYLYENIPPLPENMNADALLFKLEGLYLVGEYDEAIKLSDEILSEISEKEFLLIEQPDWSSGFAQCELLEFSPDEFWFRMVMVWRSLALCRAEPQDSREAVVSIQKIMSGERFCDYDPHAPFCFFANYRVLNETGAGEIDRNTAVGMAFKRLQLRAGRIDDSETRRAFLSNQYWNKILFNTAKEYKLI